MKRYAAIGDVIEQVLAPMLGEYIDDYNLEAIFDASFAWRSDRDDAGNTLLNTAGFEQAVSTPELWSIIEANELPSDLSIVVETHDGTLAAAIIRGRDTALLLAENGESVEVSLDLFRSPPYMERDECLHPDVDSSLRIDQEGLMELSAWVAEVAP